MCDALHITREDYDEAVCAFGCLQPTSLDQPIIGADHLTIGGGIAEDNDPDAAVEARTMLGPIVRDLSERDRRILYLRFIEDRTQQQIGNEFGVPQMQVSRWLSRIFDQIRGELVEPAAAS